MTVEQVHLVRRSFIPLERQPNVAALVFYRRLFELNPALRPLFRTDIEEQTHKLMDMLALLLSRLDHPADLQFELEQLGARHAGYGVREEHYAVVGRALLDMLEDMLDSDFTPAVGQAWLELYQIISESMLRGARVVAMG